MVGGLAVRDAPAPPRSPVDPSVSRWLERVRKPQAQARGMRFVTSTGHRDAAWPVTRNPVARDPGFLVLARSGGRVS